MKKIMSFMSFMFFCHMALLFGSEQKPLPRIGIAGISIECSTFSPAVTPLEAFRQREGEALLGNYPYLSSDSLIGKGAVWLPAMMSSATPGGIITRETYETLVGKTLDLIRANMPYDGFFYHIHGAMSVVGLDDPEGDFLERIRGIIGNDAIVSTSMDLHGNVSTRLAEFSDLITCFRMAPHEDAAESIRRAVVNLYERITSGKGRPAYKAWVAVPILLPGERTSTRVEPGKSLYAMIPGIEALPGVVDAGIWISYAWADEPRNQGVVMVVGDDREQVGSSAKKLAEKFWSVRRQFDFEAPAKSLDECLDAAIASKKKPFFISDMGDNPTGGGAGDVTWTLARLLRRPEFKTPKSKTVIYASIPGPEMIAEAKKAGVGGQAEAMVGAMEDNRFEGPVKLSGTVMYTSDREAVIKTGNIHVIVTQSRAAYHYESGMTAIGLKPREADIVIVKQGYLVPDWYNMQADWMMAHTRGGVDQDLVNLPFKRVVRPMYPLDPNMADPELNVIFVPSARCKYGR
ncbi:MAG: M81 family metallopeptidase [Holophagales bacterium]|jgi:microcystin degradation protein MlrC|nr:M81 family metallopeptidase [Holophagales bacterium]